MDWFMNLTTPATPTLDDLGKDLFSLPTSELAAQISQGTTPKEMPLSEYTWKSTYPQGVHFTRLRQAKKAAETAETSRSCANPSAASEAGSIPQASRNRQDPVSSMRDPEEVVDPMLQEITTAVSGPLSDPVNAPAPAALQGGQDTGLNPQTPASLPVVLNLSNGYKDKDTRGDAYDGARRQLLFPALAQLDTRDVERSRPRFDPCVSPLLALFSRTKVDEAARQTAAEAISFIMSQECQRSLPAAWWPSGLGQHTARGIGWVDLPFHEVPSLIRSKYGRLPARGNIYIGTVSPCLRLTPSSRESDLNYFYRLLRGATRVRLVALRRHRLYIAAHCSLC